MAEGPFDGDWDAVVLAGGTARRLGGVDKMLVEVGGTRLIDRALAAVAEANKVIVVGDPRPDTVPVTWTREHPPGGGPVAALAAGLALVEAPLVALLAADLPFVAARHVWTMLRYAGAEGVDGALYVNPLQNRAQTLVSAWQTASLRAALPEQPDGKALHRMLAPLVTTRLIAGEVWLADCDTPEDLEAARRRARGEIAP